MRRYALSTIPQQCRVALPSRYRAPPWWARGLYICFFAIGLFSGVAGGAPSPVTENLIKNGKITATASKAEFDRAKRLYVLSGTVEIKQNGMILRGERVLVQESNDGFYVIRAYSRSATQKITGGKALTAETPSTKIRGSSEASPSPNTSTRASSVGELAHFSYETPNTGVLTEGAAHLMEYNNKTQVLRLSGNATLRRIRDQKITEQASGEAIVYNRLTEFFSLTEEDKAGKASSDGVQIVIDPKN